MNVKLLRTIQAHIVEEPRRLNMADWGAQIDAPKADEPPCGTVGCIAGWACWLGMKRPPLIRVQNFSKMRQETQLDYDRAECNGKRLLGLSKEESDRLFYVGEENFGWPSKFRARYKRCKTPKGKAAVTAQRIEHFIKTKGAE